MNSPPVRKTGPAGLININKPVSGDEQVSNPGAHLRFKASP
jgi:hypothetical protein